MYVIGVCDVIRKVVTSLECLLGSIERLCLALRVMEVVFICDFEQSERVNATNKQ